MPRWKTGIPQVAYREAISRRAEFNYTHKKQTGGSGQYGRVAGFVEPLAEGDYEFLSLIKGGAIPSEYIPACDKGFKEAMAKGTLIGFPIVGVKVTINDGQSHAVDSSDMAFQAAARGAFREVYPKAKPIILEPIMKVTVEGPHRISGKHLRIHQPAPGNYHLLRGGWQLLQRRGGGAPERNVRLLHKPAFHYPGEG